MLLTREEVLSIEQYCIENNVSKQVYLRTNGISNSRYYRSKERLRLEDESEAEKSTGSFIELSSKPGVMLPAMMPPKKTHARPIQTKGSNLIIELQMNSGNAMRIQGNISPNHLRELMTIMKESNV